MKVKDIAEYFLLCADDKEEGMSNLKLQKLCYYAQGIYLAIYDKPLFNEHIEAWMHGPVCPELYQEYKKYQSKDIEFNKNDYDFEKSGLTKEQAKFLDDIYLEFGQYTAWKLREMTHQEKPWLDLQNNMRATITHEAMRSYFKDQLI